MMSMTLVSLIQSYNISGTSIIASTSGFVVFYIEYKYPAINTALEGFNSGKEWIYCLFPKNLNLIIYQALLEKSMKSIFPGWRKGICFQAG